MSETILYGIPNCDRVRAARRWLQEHQVAYRFHDTRKNGLTRNLVRHWVTTLTPELLLNRRGTTWRQLTEEQRKDLDVNRTIDLILDTPTLMKRPLLSTRNCLLIGFDADEYARLLEV